MHNKIKCLFAEYLIYIQDPTPLQYTPKGQGVWGQKHISTFKKYLKWRFGENYHSLLCKSLELSNNELAEQIEEFTPIFKTLSLNRPFSDDFYIKNTDN